MHSEPSAIADIGYDEQHAKLFIRLESGERLMYVGVPSEVHRAFADAPSKGGFYGAEIRDCYPYNLLDA